jgi:hypothetical protein
MEEPSLFSANSLELAPRAKALGVSPGVTSMRVKEFSCDGDLSEKNLGLALKRHLSLHSGIVGLSLESSGSQMTYFYDVFLFVTLFVEGLSVSRTGRSSGICL